MVRFDGYTASTQAANHYQLADLFGPGLSPAEGRGFHTFGHRLSLKDDTGIEVGSVQWGGMQGDRSCIEVKGERTPEVVERLRSAFPHRVTRMDPCADFDAPGSFERLLAVSMAIKTKHRLKGERRGDWEDFPELGRTQYLGSPQSVAMLRLYEKGKQPEYRHLPHLINLVRAELQIRPAKGAKTEFSKLTALEAWGASAWSRELAGEILREHIDPHPAGTVYRKTSLDARTDWLCRQGGATLLELYEALGNDWKCVGLTLGEKIKEQRNASH